MAKGWNISFWVKNMEGQVFAKIFHYILLFYKVSSSRSKIRSDFDLDK